jgi:thiamine biosynthesis lipoprotein ApbE
MCPENCDQLVHVSRRAMATEFEVCFPSGKCPEGTRFALDALGLVEAAEEQLSYFRPTSQVSRVNRSAADGPVQVEPRLFELLCLAAKLCEQTGGAYDITSAPLSEAWGFARRAGEVPSEAQLAEARTRVGGHLWELDSAQQTVRFLQPGVQINLGSIGKGYALDVCAERLLTLGMTDFLLHGGQSSVLAHGSPLARGEGRGGREEANDECRMMNDESPEVAPPDIHHPSFIIHHSSWEIGVSHPCRVGQRLAVIRLHDRALGTSSA